jgi:lysophospholipase L1-like esterase
MLSRQFTLSLAFLGATACTADDQTPVDVHAEAGPAAVSEAGAGSDTNLPDVAAMSLEDVSVQSTPDADTSVPIDARADVASRVPSFIVVVGSSTAAGFGLADPATSWVERYATYLKSDLPGSKVTNLAVSGYSTYQVQPTGTVNPNGRPAVDPAHNITAAILLHPDAIIVNLPSNDAAANVPVEDSMANLKVVAAKAKDANVAIWITTTQPRQLAASGIALIIGLRDRIKQEFGDHAIDFFTPLAAADGTPLAMYNQGDGTHPNAEGHRLLFQQVKAADLPAAIAKLGGGNASRD